MKKHINKFFLTTAAILFFACNFSPALAQTSVKSDTCTTTTLHFINEKTREISSTTKIPAKKAGEYGFQVQVKTNIGCSLGTYSLKAERYTDEKGSHSTPVETIDFATNTRIDKDNFIKNHFITGQPSPYTYSFILTVTSNVSTLTSVVNIYFTDDKGVTGGSTTPTPDTKVTNTTTNTTTPNNSKNNNQINTGVTASLGTDLDDTIGFFSNPLTKDTLPELLASILRILFILVGMISVIIIIIAGFRMVLASGNEAELTKAKAAITWAIIGLVVSLMAFSIVAIVQRLIQVGA